MNKKILILIIGLIGGIVLFLVGFYVSGLIYQQNHPLKDAVLAKNVINYRMERSDQGLIYYQAVKKSDDKSQKIVIVLADSAGKTLQTIDLAGAARLLSVSWSPNHKNALVAV